MKIEFLETIKVLDGKLLHLHYHQKRYESVLASYGIEHFNSLSTYIKAPKEGLFRCRIIYDLHGKIDVSFYPYQKRMINSLKLLEADELCYEKKFAQREVLDELFEQRERCDDVLIVKNGYITDTSIANIALFDGEQWFTPTEPLLRGTTRQRLIETGFLLLRDISVESLKNYDKMAVMNAMVDFDIIAKKIEEIIC
jgi:4-amino-4-deoxychorismate lyase